MDEQSGARYRVNKMPSKFVCCVQMSQIGKIVRYLPDK